MIYSVDHGKAVSMMTPAAMDDMKNMITTSISLAAVGGELNIAEGLIERIDVHLQMDATDVYLGIHPSR